MTVLALCSCCIAHKMHAHHFETIETKKILSHFSAETETLRKHPQHRPRKRDRKEKQSEDSEEANRPWVQQPQVRVHEWGKQVLLLPVVKHQVRPVIFHHSCLSVHCSRCTCKSNVKCTNKGTLWLYRFSLIAGAEESAFTMHRKVNFIFYNEFQFTTPSQKKKYYITFETGFHFQGKKANFFSS